MSSTSKALSIRRPLMNIIIFFGATLMVLVLLFMQFGAVRLTPTKDYYAVLASSSGIKDGESVRIAGVEVGKVRSVEVWEGDRARVGFDVDADKPLTGGTRAVVRYANLTGDRFLELADGPGPADRLAEGGTIPLERTQPALDIDVLLQGFTPLLQGLSPEQVNQFAGEVVTVLQGQGGTIESLFTSTSALTNSLADRDQVIGEVVTNLNTVLGTLNDRGDQVSETVVRLQQLVSGLSADRERIGGSLEHIDALTTSVAGLLVDARPPLKGTLEQLGRTATQLDEGRDTVDEVLRTLPGAYYAMHRAGSHGSYFNFYLCTVRVKLTGPDGDPFFTPYFGPNSQIDRCKDNP